jgi:SAM-dependent methyltransferase
MPRNRRQRRRLRGSRMECLYESPGKRNIGRQRASTKFWTKRLRGSPMNFPTSTSRFSADTGAGAALQQIYGRRFQDAEHRRKLVWKVLSEEFFNRWVYFEDSVLDLGAGYCEFINSVEARKKYAIDLNPSTVTRAQNDVQVITQDVRTSWDISDSSVDVVFTSNFLEHLGQRCEVTHCLRESRRVLRPGGRLIALGPNIRYASRVYWDYFDHALPLSDRSLVEALELTGFKPIVVIPRFLPFSMRSYLPISEPLVRFYLETPMAWKVLGKQFLVVARR